MPRDAVLLRLAGLAALAGAGLRLAAAFPALNPGLSGEALYFMIDLLLSLGLVGLFAGSGRFRTWLGALGFAGALAGFELIRTGARLGGAGAYQRGSAILGLGLALAGLALVQGKGLTRYAGGAWLISLAVGLAGSALHWPTGFLVASLFFCLGFALGGVWLLRGGDQRRSGAKRKGPALQPGPSPDAPLTIPSREACAAAGRRRGRSAGLRP